MSEPAPGSVIASRYRVIKELGRGGMGAVYLVEHVNTGERHALKALLAHAGARPEMVERFRREARTPSRIRSENVCKVTDADVAPELGGAPFMVMELLEGQDLDQRLNQRGPLSPQELLDIFTPVAQVLDQAHALGIVHRDLKPDNLFLHHRADGQMVVKVVDFGIAKLLGGGDDGGDAKLTGAGMIMGTPLFMAPEQARGDGASIGPATDIWALGQVAYYALSGQAYWPGPSTGEVMVQILSSAILPPSGRLPGLPPAFDAWFARSCARDPNERWPSAGAQLAGLREALASVVGAPTLGPAQPPSAMATAPSAMPMGPSATTAQAPLHASPVAASPVMATTAPPAKGDSGRGLLIGLAALLVVGVGAAMMLIRQGSEQEPRASTVEDEDDEPAQRPKRLAAATASSDKRSAGEPQVMSALNGGATGYYEPQQLLTLIEPHLPEVKACYAAELDKQPQLKGTVFLTLMLGADHKPMSASCVPQMEGGMPRALCPCLQGKVTRWQFPPPKKPLPMISVGYKFLCSTE